MPNCIVCNKEIKGTGKTGKCHFCLSKGNKSTKGQHYDIRKRHKLDCRCVCCQNIRGEYKQSIDICLKKSKSLKGRVPGMLGKHRTVESKNRMSNIMTGKHWKCSEEARKNMMGSSPGHKRGTRIYFEVPNQGRVCLRSTYEEIYAKYLVAKRVDFRYEHKRFILDAKTYLPDFYLVNEDKFIEIKGWVRDSDAQIMKEMKIFHPDIKIEMVVGHEIDKYKLVENEKEEKG